MRTRRSTLIDRRALLYGGAAAGLVGGPAAAWAQQPAERGEPAAPISIDVEASPIASFERVPTGKTRFGALEYRGGLQLTSAIRDFGGWSGLVVSDDGRRLLTVSDQGSWLTAEIAYEAGRPSAIRKATLGPLLSTGARPLDRKREADAEAVTMLDGSLSRGTVLVAFERMQRIARCPINERGLGPPLGFLKLPADAKRMRANAGFESVCVIRGGAMAGSVVAFAEEMHDLRRNHTGWIWPGGIGGEPQKLGFVNTGDFAVTDLASLPDGSLIVLERRFRWLEGVQMRMRLIKSATVRPGALLDGEVLVHADMAYQIDNMEGLALHKGPRGETVLTLISDNNFNSFLQRTLLLQFALVS